MSASELGTSSHLSDLEVCIRLKKLSVDYFKASDALKTWGLSEGNDLGVSPIHCDPDNACFFMIFLLQDIISASSSLLKIFSSALVEYASHGDFMRKQLKVIRTKEESLDNLKRSRRNARRKAKNVDKKLSKMASDSKNLEAQKDSLVRLQEEIRKMDSVIMFEEAALSDFKKTTTKAWMGLKFGGLVQCCQKGTVRNLVSSLVPIFSSLFTSPNLDCGRIWKISHCCE